MAGADAGWTQRTATTVADDVRFGEDTPDDADPGERVKRAGYRRRIDPRPATTVLRLITRMNIGGPTRQALLLTHRLRHSHPTVLAAGQAPPSEGELTDTAVPVHRIPLVRPLSPRQDAASIARTRRLIRELRPRILHTHMAKAGAVGRLAALSIPGVRPRTVHTFHGHVLEGYFSPAVERSFIAAERALARRTDVLIAVSPEVRDSLLDLGVGEPSRYRVVPLGFELDEHLAVRGPSHVLRERLRLDENTPLLGIVGRLAPIKDHRTLLRAMPDIPSAHLAILGDGQERGPLSALARELGVADRVHFTGWWHDVPGAMADLDVVVLTSRNEGTPVSLIEAGACARPVVATRVGGVEHVVEDGSSGLLVPAGEPAAVARAVNTLLASPATRSEMGSRGRRLVRDRFSADRLMSDITAIYDELAPR